MGDMVLCRGLKEGLQGIISFVLMEAGIWGLLIVLHIYSTNYEIYYTVKDWWYGGFHCSLKLYGENRLPQGPRVDAKSDRGYSELGLELLDLPRFWRVWVDTCLLISLARSQS